MRVLPLLILALLPPAVSAGEVDCANAMTTLEINRCAGMELEAAEAEMLRYLNKSLEHHGDDPELTAAIEQAQTAWGAYAESHCQSVYTKWRGGTIRGVAALSCRTRITRERTHALWSSFLTYMDGSEPLLPEPETQ